MDAFDSFMGAWSFRLAVDSASSGVEIPAAESHFGPCVTVETRCVTIGGAMRGQDVRVEYMKMFFKRQLLDGYSFCIAAHSVNQMLRDIKCRENQHACKSELIRRTSLVDAMGYRRVDPPQSGRLHQPEVKPPFVCLVGENGRGLSVGRDT